MKYLYDANSNSILQPIFTYHCCGHPPLFCKQSFVSRQVLPSSNVSNPGLHSHAFNSTLQICAQPPLFEVQIFLRRHVLPLTSSSKPPKHEHTTSSLITLQISEHPPLLVAQKSSDTQVCWSLAKTKLSGHSHRYDPSTLRHWCEH